MQQIKWKAVAIAATCIVVLFLIVNWGWHRIFDPKPPQTTRDVAFVISQPDPDETQVIASRDRIVYGVVDDPARSSKLITVNYAETINKAAFDQIQLPAVMQIELAHALQGIIMIESGGSSLPVSTASAAGVVQMMPKTARQFGLVVSENTARTDKLLRMVKAGDRPAYAELARVDERFNPYQCIKGGARFLTSLFNHYGRWDFAVAAYHGGQGNIDKLIWRYAKESMCENRSNIRQLVNANGLSYSRIFFGCSPASTPATYRIMKDYKSSEKDFSAQYYWNVLAAEQAIKLFQDDSDRFTRKVNYWKDHRGKSAEAMWYGPEVNGYKSSTELQAAYDSGELVPAPCDPKVMGYKFDNLILGNYVLKAERTLFQGSRPETIGLLMTIASLTRQQSGHWDEALTVTGLVETQASLTRRTIMKKSAPAGGKFNTTGRTINIARNYRSEAQRIGFQYALDFLKDRGDICYTAEGMTVHVTLNPDLKVVENYRQIYQIGTQHLASFR